jgi:hypothetical protein
VNKTWTLIQAKGIPPTERYGHAARSSGNFLFIAGGIGIAGPVSDICVFDICKHPIKTRLNFFLKSNWSD